MAGMSSGNDAVMGTLLKVLLPRLPGRFQKGLRKDEALGSGMHLPSVLNTIFNSVPYVTS